MTKLDIRLATITDAEAITEMLIQLADDIGDQDKFSSTAQNIRDHGFGPKPLFQCFIASQVELEVTEDGEEENQGLVLFFPLFSTTRGEPGVYVQDLWVSASTRGLGLGGKLLARTANFAAKEWGATYLGLTVYDDNKSATKFYQNLGFTSSSQDQPMTLNGESFNKLSAG